MQAKSRTPPPPPPPTPPARRPAGYQIRADLDDAVRAYQEKTGAQRKAILDQALEEYLTARGMWTATEQ